MGTHNIYILSGDGSCNKIQQKLASGFWHIQARPESGTERLAVASGFVGIRYAIVDSRLGDDVGGVGPILLVVVSVLYVGATLSERLARAVHTAAERERTIPPSLAAGVVRVAVLATAAVIALEAAGITAYLPVVVLSICLAGVLALIVAGLIIGGRGLLESILAARYVEEQYIEGQMVTFQSQRAQIRSIGLMAMVVRISDGIDHTTPNAVFLKESV